MKRLSIAVLALALNSALSAVEATDTLKPLVEFANKGDADANAQLGVLSLLKDDFENALKYLKVASDSQHAFANRQLMMMFADGLGVKRDMTEATKYSNRSVHSEKGDNYIAVRKLAKMSPEKKALLSICRKQLLDSLKKGITDGTLGALHYLATLQVMGRDEYRKDPAGDIRLFERAANKGSVVAMNQIGVLSEMLGDEAAALKWYTLAAEKNYTPAMYSLATLYQTGHGNFKNSAKFYNWMKRAADLGDNIAIQRMISFCALEEPGFEGRQKETVDWLKKGAANDDSVSQCFLGEMYLSGGPDLKIDVKQGIGLLQKACDAQEPRAYYQLGLAYLNGNGVIKDKQKAKALLQESALRGYEDAPQALKEFKFD